MGAILHSFFLAMKQLLTPAVPAALPHLAAPERRTWLKRLAATLGGGLLARAATASPTQVQTSSSGYAYVGEIVIFAFGFEPRGYARCDGRLLSIQQNTALFSILGTTYGGDGRTTFGLPNLQGASAIGQGQGQGLTAYTMGPNPNGETVTLTTSQLPAHTHTLPASTAMATGNSPVGQVPAVAAGLNVNGEAVAVQAYGNPPAANASPQEIGVTGTSQAVLLQSPYLVINYCIGLYGEYPQRP